MNDLTKPLYTVNDFVEFNYYACTELKQKSLIGKIKVVENQGTFVNPNDVCYDILVVNKEDNNPNITTIFKHVPEFMIVQKLIPSSEQILDFVALGV